MDLTETSLWSDFRGFVQERHYRVAPDVVKEIRELIAHGVAEMNRLEYSHSRKEVARSKLLLFASEMVQLAKRQHTELLSANIFGTIKEDICPLPPFC